MRVKPEFDIPPILRGGVPSAGVVDHLNGDTLIVVVDGKSVPYQPWEVEPDACGTGDILVLYRAGDPVYDQDCPVCGTYHTVRRTSQRLATPDEVPAA